MSIFHRNPSMLIPHTWQRAPMLAHGFIIHDAIYTIYQQPERSWNTYYAPACQRKPQIRAMSQRAPVYREAKRRLPVAATIHYFSQIKMQRHIDAINASRNRL